jgi:hypothetical protein
MTYQRGANDHRNTTGSIRRDDGSWGALPFIVGGLTLFAVVAMAVFFDRNPEGPMDRTTQKEINRATPPATPATKPQ